MDNSELPESLRRLVGAIDAEERLTPTSTRRLLLQSEVTAADLEPWHDFDHPAADSYGRKMVHDGGWFELMVMSWAPGDLAAIHDHGYTQWGAVKLFGPAEHAIFRLDDGVLTTAERKVFAPGSVVAVQHDLIHQMGNVGPAPFVSLHLYGSYERDGDVTADARLYELDEGAVQITSGGVFFALPESAVSRREKAPPSDFATRLRYKVELLKRLMTMHGSWLEGLRPGREARLAAELGAPETWEEGLEELARIERDNGLRREPHAGILRQELAAAARLQLDLIDAGLLAGELAARRDRLAELVRHSAAGDFAAVYLGFVEETLLAVGV